jgi:hypothetical protein
MTFGHAREATRPLLISDCDEVLLHMVKHFGDWLGDAHDIDFTPSSWELGRNMRRRDTGEAPSREQMMGFLDGFFPPTCRTRAGRIASTSWPRSASRIAWNATRGPRVARWPGWWRSMAIR